MRIRLTTGYSDAQGGSWSAGDLVDLPDWQAVRFINRGLADPAPRRKTARAKGRPARTTAAVEADETRG